MTEQTQLFGALDDATLASLRESIRRLGVLVPVAKDQHGNMLDGHHRKAVADELGVRYRVDVINVRDAEQANEIRRTLNVDRRQLSGDDLKRHIVALAEYRRPDGVGALSQSEIADRAGVSDQYVSKVLSTAELPTGRELPTHRQGKDGKVRPASRPAVVTAKNEREAERAQAALAVTPPTLASPVLDVKRVERVAREHVAEQRRAEPVQAVTSSGTERRLEVRHGDFREVLGDLAGQVDAIITDPPYPQEFWHLLDDLGAIAGKLLKPNGVLAVMTGTRLAMVDHAEAAFGAHLRRRHRAVYLVPGQRWRDQVEHVATGYKPILIYGQHSATDVRWLNDDIFRSDEWRQDSRFHHWGQSESGFASLVERLTDPASLVLDPFLGGGTTGVVCRDLGRDFVGCDVDAAAIHASRERL